MNNVPRLNLNTDGIIPVIGFGTWQLSPKQARTSVKDALEIGYRLIDTAKIYGNEREVGEAIRSSKISREDIFVTTKLWTSDQGYESVLGAFNQSLLRLGLEYVDLYLIHWPGRNKMARTDSWRALSEINEQGRAKSIGVSNFTIRHLEELLKTSELVPAVNQIEFHPFIYEEQKELLEYCKSKDIIFEAYSPLARGRVKNELLSEIGIKHGKSTSQIMIRWAIQHGAVPIPRSRNIDHIKENFEVFDFELSKNEMESINSLSSGQRQSWDPTDLP